MGEHLVTVASDPESVRELTLALLDDLDALDAMLRDGRLESDVRRIGAEQEIVLVDASCEPAPVATGVLDRLDDPAFTTELGAYNLELNAAPLALRGDCLFRLHERIDRHLRDAAEAAADVDARLVLCGILPTLRKSDLTLANMTPDPRYVALNEALGRLRGNEPWQLSVRGADQLACTHDSVMLESVCTSFQIHLQVAAAEFAPLYNLAQAVSGPVLAAAANSPLLFGRRLWHETRVPVFQQSIDTRRAGDDLREMAARVRFGEAWLQDSILELFREDVVRFRVLLGELRSEPALEILGAGGVPRLRALQVYNGTVYRWNRGCYGITDDEPHLRIEMRALPAGPSVLDEIANAALAFGLVLGLHGAGVDVRGRLPFAAARANFQAAAESGLATRTQWLDGRSVDTRDLLLEELLPVARQGLVDARVDADDVDHYLDVVRQRVRRRRTGSTWLLDSFARLQSRASRQRITRALTEALIDAQAGGLPVHEWELADLPGVTSMNLRQMRVEEIMTTDIHTVGPEEPIDVVGKIMEWRSIRHVPVEDADRQLVGMLSCFHVLREIGRRQPEPPPSRPVRELMTPAPPTVEPRASVAEALRRMREEEADYVAVVRDGRLVGIVTERDFVALLASLLEDS